MPRLYSWKVIFYLIFVFVVDLAVIPAIGMDDARPIFLYLAVLYSAFEWNWFKTVRIAFIVGLMRDLAGTQPLGVETIVLIAASFFAGILIQKIERNSAVIRGMISAIYVSSVCLATFIFSAMLGGPGISARALGLALLTGVWTGVFAPGFFALSHRWLEGRMSSLKQYELFN